MGEVLGPATGPLWMLCQPEGVAPRMYGATRGPGIEATPTAGAVDSYQPIGRLDGPPRPYFDCCRYSPWEEP